jgi:hypothetical protein
MIFHLVGDGGKKNFAMQQFSTNSPARGLWHHCAGVRMKLLYTIVSARAPVLVLQRMANAALRQSWWKSGLLASEPVFWVFSPVCPFAPF